MGIWIWLKSLFGKTQTSLQIGKGNRSVQTGDNSPIQQISINTSGNPTIHQGISAEELAKIVRDMTADHASEVQGRDDRIKELETQVASAPRRPEEADRQGVPDTKGRIEQLRQSGDTARLLEFLLVLAEAGKEDVELRREIAAVAYLRGEIDVAERALQDILRVLPDDLVALNRMGHVHDARGRLDEARASYTEKSGNIRAAWIGAAAIVAAAIIGGIVMTILSSRQGIGRKELAKLEIRERLGSQEGMADDYGNLGLLYQTRGDLDEAERMHRKSLEINRRLGRPEGMAIQYANLGTIYQTRGDGKQAREYWIKSRDLYTRIGVLHMVKQMQGWIDELNAPEESGEEN